MGIDGKVIGNEYMQLYSRNCHIVAGLASDEEGTLSSPGHAPDDYVLIARVNGRIGPLSQVTVQAGHVSRQLLSVSEVTTHAVSIV